MTGQGNRTQISLLTTRRKF